MCFQDVGETPQTAPNGITGMTQGWRRYSDLLSTPGRRAGRPAPPQDVGIRLWDSAPSLRMPPALWGRSEGCQGGARPPAVPARSIPRGEGWEDSAAAVTAGPGGHLLGRWPPARGSPLLCMVQRCLYSTSRARRARGLSTDLSSCACPCPCRLPWERGHQSQG